MAEPKWEKLKMKEEYRLVAGDEVVLVIIGILVFSLSFLEPFKVLFIGFVVIWYWLRIRGAEIDVHKKKQEIYNVYYDKIRPVVNEIIERETEKARAPLRYELEQLEYKRKALVDKFVVINLILVVLIQLFIST